MKNFKIEYHRSSGPGGQRKNKKETAVRITHLPTGITAVATENRSQARNKEIALERIHEKIVKLFRKKKQRIPTKVSRGAKERRIEDKKKHSFVKSLRRKVTPEQ
jgi:protein subunit release factor A